MSRGRRRPNAHIPGTQHTSREWQFTQKITLMCPDVASHEIGDLFRDIGEPRTRPSIHEDTNLKFSGPPGDIKRTLRWSCPRCDARAEATRTYARSGAPRRHDGTIKAGLLLDLLDALANHGPPNVRVQLLPEKIAALLERVRTGAQLAVSPWPVPGPIEGSAPSPVTVVDNSAWFENQDARPPTPKDAEHEGSDD